MLFLRESQRAWPRYENDFRYPGPKSKTREAGVVSIADSCEAAVRAMENPTNQRFKNLLQISSMIGS